jgi:thioredoxin-like negative regulator of GroEL
MSSRFAKRLLLLAAALFLLPLIAAAAQPYDGKVFADAQANGKSILVEVTAPWCPTCAKQKPIIEGIETEKPELTVLNVDFDSAKDVLKQFGVEHQSTLIVFRGVREVGRSTGQTDAQAIRDLIGKAL